MSRIAGAMGRVGRAAVEPVRAVTVGFWRGITYPFRGMKVVYVQHLELARFWLWPVGLTLVSLALVVWAGLEWREDLVAVFWSTPTGEGVWAAIARFLHSIVELLVAIVAIGVGIVTVMLLTSVFAAPFNDLLSEAVETIRTGRPGAPFSWRVMIRDTIRTVLLEIAKLCVYLMVMVPLFIASLLLPVIGQIAYTVFGFLFTAAYFAIDYVDWPASRRDRGIRYRFGMLKRHFWAMFGFGAGVWLFLFVPFLNLFLMPAAVAGGTLLFLDLEGDVNPRPDTASNARS